MNEHECTQGKTLEDIRVFMQKIDTAIFDPEDGMKKQMHDTTVLLRGKGKEPGVLDDVRENTKFRMSMNHFGKKISVIASAFVVWLVKLQFFNN